jgi:DNA-binding transcriptional LysR family regulator
LTEAEDSLLKLDADTSGLVRVDSAISFILHIIVPLIPEFNARYPHIQIELQDGLISAEIQSIQFKGSPS